MEALTPASAGDLPPIGELVADDLFWRYLAGSLRREGVAHLQVWTTATVPPGDLAVVTETGHTGSVTESAGEIWAELAGSYGPPLVLLEHRLAPEFGEGVETLDLDLHLADRGGKPSSRPVGTLDGQLRVPNRQQAGELVRLM